MGLGDILGKLFGGKGSGPAAVDKSALVDQIQKSDLFKLLPRENIEAMLERMETVKVKNGEKIIKQGEEGDFYYLISEGKAQVLREQPGKPAQVLADLDPPIGVGEDALISNAPRNATVVMKENGVILRLSRDAFNDFVKEPLLTWYSSAEAVQKVKEGAQWIDVREGGSLSDGMVGAVHIPFAGLRQKLDELDKSTSYICYCENGRMSSTAAFVMHQNGFNVGVLRGGLRRMKQRAG